MTFPGFPISVRGRRFSRAHGDRRAQAILLNEIGKAHRRLGKYARALTSYEQAQAIAQGQGLLAEEATTLNNIAIVLRYQGMPWQALDLLHESRDIWHQLGEVTSEAWALHNIGMAHSRLDRLEVALDYLKQALDLFPEKASTDVRAPTLTEIGRVHLRHGDLQAALRVTLQALELRGLAGDLQGKATTLEALGTIYWRQGESAAALDVYREASKIFRQLSMPQYEARVLANIGRLYESEGEVVEALEYSRRAIDGFVEAGDKPGEAHALYICALAELRRDDLGAARALMEEALEFIETWRARPDLRAQFFATRHHNYELYIEILMRLHERDPAGGFDELAFGASERSRSRGFLAELGEERSALGQHADPELLEQRDRLIQDLNASHRMFESLRRSGASPTELEAQERHIRELLADRERIRASIRRSLEVSTGRPHGESAAGTHGDSVTKRDLSSITPASLRYRRDPPEILTLQQTREQLLDDDTLLLAYSLGDERSFLWSVDATGSHSYVLPGRDEIELLATRVYSVFSTSHLPHVDSRFRAAAAHLADILLGPVAPLLSNQRLMIIPDGALQYVPFNALPKPLPAAGEPLSWQAGIANPRPLLIDHLVVHLPSASVVAWLDQNYAGRRSASPYASNLRRSGI